MLSVAKKYWRRAATAFLLCLSAAFIMISGVNSDVAAASTLTDAKVQSYEAQLAKLEKERKELAAKIAQAKKDMSDASTLKTLYDKEINIAESRNTELLLLIEELDRNIAETEQDILDKTADIDSQYDKIVQILRLSYEEGSANYLEMLLGSENLYDFFARVERIGNMLDYNKKIMQEYETAKLNLEGKHADLLEKIAYQTDQKIVLEDSIKELEKLAEKNKKALASATSSLSSAQAASDKNLAEEAKLDRELEAYLKELQAKNNAAYVGGELGWPVDLTNKTISSGYGNRTLNGVKEFHYGIDIPAAYGSPVYAANAGKVLKSEYHSSYGNYILIDHGGGKATLYAHNSKNLVSVGQEVTKGQKIAQVGSTGYSFGNHSHFEVRVDGIRVNPLEYVVKPK